MFDYNEDKIVQQLASIYSDCDDVGDVRFYLQTEAYDILTDGLRMNRTGQLAAIAADIVNNNYEDILFFARELRNETT